MIPGRMGTVFPKSMCGRPQGGEGKGWDNADKGGGGSVLADILHMSFMDDP